MDRQTKTTDNVHDVWATYGNLHFATWARIDLVKLSVGRNSIDLLLLSTQRVLLT